MNLRDSGCLREGARSADRLPLTQPTSISSTPVASISSSLARSRFMPTTDGFEEPVLIRCRGECGIASRHSMVSRGFRIGSRASPKLLRRIHWISPIQTDTRASSAA